MGAGDPLFPVILRWGKSHLNETKLNKKKLNEALFSICISMITGISECLLLHSHLLSGIYSVPLEQLNVYCTACNFLNNLLLGYSVDIPPGRPMWRHHLIYDK